MLGKHSTIVYPSPKLGSQSLKIKGFIWPLQDGFINPQIPVTLGFVYKPVRRKLASLAPLTVLFQIPDGRIPCDTLKYRWWHINDGGQSLLDEILIECKPCPTLRWLCRDR
jgi:hypothetical protein